MGNDQRKSQVDVQFATSIQDAPTGDGSKWVGLHIHTPVAAYVVGMSADAARSVAKDLPKMLNETADLANRQSSGIIAVPADALNNIKRPKH